MDASCVQLHHQTSSESLENIIMGHARKQEMEEKKGRGGREEALKCPRCDSNNTKFCYYNNYSLTQPRYFCKSCRRYWTKGGTLRNVPVGGGCRKNKRCSSIKRNHHDLITSPNTFSPQLLTSYQTGNYNDFVTTHNGGSGSGNGNGNGNGNLPFLGNTHFDLFGGGADNHQLHAGVGSNLYYGGGNSVNLMSHEEEHQQQQMGMHFDLLQLQSHHHHEVLSGSNPSSGSSTPTIKQEFELGGDANRLLLNYVMNGGGAGGGGGGGGGDGLGSTSCHNLINSPLMYF